MDAEGEHGRGDPGRRILAHEGVDLVTGPRDRAWETPCPPEESVWRSRGSETGWVQSPFPWKRAVGRPQDLVDLENLGRGPG